MLTPKKSDPTLGVGRLYYNPSAYDEKTLAALRNAEIAYRATLTEANNDATASPKTDDDPPSLAKSQSAKPQSSSPTARVAARGELPRLADDDPNSITLAPPSNDSVPRQTIPARFPNAGELHARRSVASGPQQRIADGRSAQRIAQDPKPDSFLLDLLPSDTPGGTFNVQRQSEKRPGQYAEALPKPDAIADDATTANEESPQSDIDSNGLVDSMKNKSPAEAWRVLKGLDDAALDRYLDRSASVADGIKAQAENRDLLQDDGTVPFVRNAEERLKQRLRPMHADETKPHSS
ncbi:MAG: hypothetical protein AAFN70_20655, partial [Planctomycetota bacterium]